MADPHFKRASGGPECSRVRASSIMPNSRVPEWVSTGMRPVSTRTTRKKATAASTWAGRTIFRGRRADGRGQA